ncbi:hypothetical protein BBJ28_00006152 [Nothophytophthora sp. Chile5]|nr:hypothetical protein BBJ28_00006152 [Nothophytophthora sp. Chile5]
MTATRPASVSAPQASSKKQETANKSTAPSTSAATTLGVAALALNSSAESLHLLAQQQEDYRWRLQQLQQRRPVSVATAATSAKPASTSPSTAPAPQAKDKSQLAQEEARRLQLAMAQQQVQQYQAMTRELEAQSGIAMTPSSSIGSTAARDMPRTHEEFQRLRQAQLARLQQNVQQQAVQVAAQVAAQQRASDDWLRNKLLLEQEHLRVVSESPRKKRKTRTPLEMQMEELARVCLRLGNARNDFDMRQGLEKMLLWLQRCSEPTLLQLAQRDFRDTVARRRPLLVQAQRWPMDLQVKCESITEKMVQMLAGLLLQAKPTAAATEPDAKAQDLTTIESAYAAVKVQLKTKQLELQQKAKTKREAAAKSKREAAAAAAAASAAALMQAAQKRPLPVQIPCIPAALMKPRPAVEVPNRLAPVPARPAVSTSSLTPAISRPVVTSTPPISPRVAQHLYDLDLAPRSCLMAPSEGEEKLYLPAKLVAKVMRKALPAVEETTKASAAVFKQEAKDSNGQEPAQIASTEAAKTLESSTGDAAMASRGPEEQKPEIQATERGQARPSSASEPIKINDDAVTFMQECVTEFLLYMTSEARDHAALESLQKKKKTALSISGANVVQSMENLGFTPYARVLAGYNTKIKIMQDAVAHKKLERKRLKQQEAAARSAQPPAQSGSNGVESAIGGAGAEGREAKAAANATT